MVDRTFLQIPKISRSFIIVTMVTILLFKVCDVFLDLVVPYYPRQFPPGATVRYISHDFDYVVSINKFGFRGEEASLEKGQVMVFGDSFTFGFGVAQDYTWPSLLQAKLDSAPDARVVYNLGVPGTDTLYHLRIARESLEYEPSIVILSVLLADDFQQVAEALSRNKSGSRIETLEKRLIRNLKKVSKGIFPGIYKVYAKIRYVQQPSNEESASGSIVVTDDWKQQMTNRYGQAIERLPVDLQKAVLAGRINPGLFHFAAKYPERSWKFWLDLESGIQSNVEAVEEIKLQLKSLSEEIADYGGTLIVYSMPSGEFVDSAFTQNYRLYGASIPASNLETEIPEYVLKSIAIGAGTRFLPALGTFRSNRTEELFYPTDGHLNIAGSRLVADSLFDYITSNDL